VGFFFVRTLRQDIQGVPYSRPMLALTQSRFTGKERDTETGLDYFGARYYGNSRCPTFAEKL